MNITELPWWAWLVAYLICGLILVLQAVGQDIYNQRKYKYIDGLRPEEIATGIFLWPIIAVLYFKDWLSKRRSVRS